MEKIYPFFPVGETIKSKDAKSLVIAILIYIAAAAVVSVIAALVVWLLGWFPFVTRIVRLIKWVFDLYCTVGIIFAIVKYVQM
jgi:CHASE2 domain-containing sensor protein